MTTSNISDLNYNTYYKLEHYVYESFNIING